MKKRKKNRKNRWKSLRFLSMHASKSKQMLFPFKYPCGVGSKANQGVLFFQEKIMNSGISAIVYLFIL